MHLFLIFTALSLALLLRYFCSQPTGNWRQRWQQTLLSFLVPPLLLLMSAIAVLCMGPQGKMIGLHTDWFSYWLVVAGVVLVIGFGLHLAVQGWQSLQTIRTYPEINLNHIPARLLNSSTPYTAQIGFWQPQLVVSQGLLDTLTHEHLQAVLIHEQAHHYYRDTFWFFWLGWLRRITAWLPNTEPLWQELLVLRELRADHWAAQQVDPLLLAESLLIVVSAPMIGSENFSAAFSRAAQQNRLQERIDALLGEPDSSTDSSYLTWSWILLSLLPLVAVPFHS